MEDFVVVAEPELSSSVDDTTSVGEYDDELNIVTILSTDNLATLFSRKKLDEIGSECVRGFDSDEDSRKPWLTTLERGLKLAMQEYEPKTTPWAGAASVKFPLITIAALQFASRMYPALFQGHDLVKTVYTGADNINNSAVCDRIRRHMNYTLMDAIPDWESQFDKALHTLSVHGSFFKKTYTDHTTGQAKSDLVLARDFVVYYYTPSLAQAPRQSHRFPVTRNEMVTNVRSGSWLPVDDPGAPDWSKDDNAPEQSTEEAHKGSYLFIEQHTFLDLDNDGYQEPYIITVCHQTKQVVAIHKRFSQSSMKINPADAKVVSITPKDYFTPYIFLPALDGSLYGMGWAHLLGPINETVNTAVNQLIDSATLRNSQSGFITNGSGLRSGDMSFKINEWKIVQSSGLDLRNNIMPLPTHEPSQVLFALLGQMIQAGERIASISEATMGESMGSRTPVGTLSGLVEQGLKVFSGIAKRVHYSLRQELAKIAAIHAERLPEIYNFNVNGEQQEVRRLDYVAGGAQIYPYSDPSMASDSAKLGQARMIIESFQIPAIAMQFDPHEAARRIVLASGMSEPDKLVSVEPKPQQPDPEVLGRLAKLEIEKLQAMKNVEEAITKRMAKKTDALMQIITVLQGPAPQPGQDFGAVFATAVEIFKRIEDTSKGDINASTSGGNTSAEPPVQGIPAGAGADQGQPLNPVAGTQGP